MVRPDLGVPPVSTASAKDEGRMTPATRARLLAAVHRRALWLARVTEPGKAMPDFLVAQAARNLFSTVIAVLGKELQQEWLSKLFARELESHAVCVVCGQRDLMDTPDVGLCAVCWEQANQVDRELEAAVAMRRPAIGKVS